MRPAVLLLSLTFLAAPAWCQDSPIPFVDKGTAQALADTLAKENETLKADAVRLRQEVAALTAQTTTVRKWIADLGPMLDELKARSSDLATLAEALVDRSMKTKAAAAYDKNKAGQRLIVKRIEDLQQKLADLAKLIEAKAVQAEVNDAKAGRNLDLIIVLQAALSKTKVQETQLQSLVDQVDLLSARVETALGQTNAP